MAFERDDFSFGGGSSARAKRGNLGRRHRGVVLLPWIATPQEGLAMTDLLGRRSSWCWAVLGLVGRLVDADGVRGGVVRLV